MENSLKNIPEYIKASLSDRSLFMKAFNERPQSLSTMLPYDEYLSEHRVFLQKDGSLGAVFDVELKEHEAMTEKEVLRVIASTKNWFVLPENFVLQIQYDANYYSVLDKTLDEMEASYADANHVSKRLFKEKIDVLKNSCHQISEKTPMKRRLLVSLRYFPVNKTKIRLRDLKVDSLILKDQLNLFRQELANFSHYIKNFLSNSKLKITQLDDKELVHGLRRFFNPLTFYKREFAPVHQQNSLSEQLIYTSPFLDFSGITREGIKTRTLSLKTSPSFSFPGGMAQFIGLDFPFRLNLNISFPSSIKIKKFLTTKEFFLENAITARARVQKEEIKAIQESLARDDRCLQMTFNVVIEGETDEELDEKSRKVCNIFHNDLECEVIEESDIGLGLCLNTLPLNYTPDADYSSRRAIRILKSDVANFLPLFDSYNGGQNHLAVYQSRENSLVPFSLLENETSNHTVVLADTGSGKSAFVTDCIQAAKRMSPEPIVFVIDKKSSYGMLSQYYDGDLTIFDRSQEIPFSPFRGVYNEEKIAFLSKMLIMAIRLTSPNFVIESEHQTAISKALKLAYLKKTERHGLEYVEGNFVKTDSTKQVAINMNDFVVELGSLVQEGKNKEKEAITSLVTKFKPFYADGIYAKFFTEGNTEKVEKHKLFYVYDLDSLDGDPTLQTLMTMSVIEEIRCILSQPQNQGRTGFLVMEEFAMLGRNNPAFRDFAIDFAETMRKRGCWLITLTPRPQNYFDLEVGKAFWGVADNFIFLQMSSDNVDYIAEKSSLLDEASREIIRSLRTKKGQYADVFYMNKSKTRQGAFRFRQTAYDRWMSPTNALDAIEALKALEKFPNKWEALEYLVKTFPNS